MKTDSETTAPADPFWHCGHCAQVVTPSEAEITRAENAPLFSQVQLKCPRCHKHAVQLKFPAPVGAPRKTGRRGGRPQDPGVDRVSQMDPARARELFRQMLAAAGIEA